MADAEEFYESFSRSAQWGAADPNQDEGARAQTLRAALAACRLGERPRILDLGCGRGWLSLLLAKFGDVLGTDVVAVATDRARELFPQLRFEHRDLEELLAAEGPQSFDVIVSSEVLEHVPDAEKPAFLKGIHRLLKPGSCAF